MLLIGNLPRYMCDKNYHNRAWFDTSYCKNKMVQFFDSRGITELNLVSCNWLQLIQLAACDVYHKATSYIASWISHTRSSIALDGTHNC